MSNSDENKAAVRACFENASRGNFDALDEIVTADYVLHPEEVRGADGLKQMVQGYRDAFSGLKVKIDQQFTDGDYVATRYTITGTHDGDLMGAPPTGGRRLHRHHDQPLRGWAHRRRVGAHRYRRAAGPDRGATRDGSGLKWRRANWRSADAHVSTAPTGSMTRGATGFWRRAPRLRASEGRGWNNSSELGPADSCGARLTRWIRSLPSRLRRGPGSSARSTLRRPRRRSAGRRSPPASTS